MEDRPSDISLPEGAKLVRASSLPAWPDCERRWMAAHRSRLLAACGFTLNPRPTSVGAHVGSGAHAGVGFTWLEFSRAGALPPLSEAEDRTVATLRERVKAEGVLYDNTSSDLNTAETAARKILASYRDHMDLGTRALLIEQAMVGRIAEGWFLTGHCDAYLDPDARFDDLKTGVRIPAPLAQVGGYVVLGPTQGYRAKRASMTFCRRVRRTADQPPPMVREIPVPIAVRAAVRTCDEIVTKVEAFEQSTKANPEVFRANLTSYLCGNKYCPAFHTDWCPESKLKPGD